MPSGTADSDFFGVVGVDAAPGLDPAGFWDEALDSSLVVPVVLLGADGAALDVCLEAPHQK